MNINISENLKNILIYAYSFNIKYLQEHLILLKGKNNNNSHIHLIYVIEFLI